MKIQNVGSRPATAPVVDITGHVGRASRDPQQRDVAGALSMLQGSMNDLAARLVDLENRIAAAQYITVLNRTGEVVAKIGSWDQFQGAFFKNVMIGPTPASPQIYQDSSGDVFIDGDVIVDGSISATSFNVNRPEPVGLTVTNNSPSSGRVAWNAHSIIYAGTAYAITASDTANALIWWNVGDTTLSSGSSYTPQAGRFLMLTNASGTNDTAWNKNASSGIVRSHLNFALLEGMALQPPVEVTGINLNPASPPQETTILNVSGSAGVLLAVQIKAESGTTGSVVATLRFTIDGATAQDYQVWDAAGAGDGRFKTAVKDLSDFPQVGLGDAAGDLWTKSLGIPFTTSCNVKVRVTGANGSAKTAIGRAEYALKV